MLARAGTKRESARIELMDFLNCVNGSGGAMTVRDAPQPKSVNERKKMI